ncbi:MAG TPA: S8 family serine peptidase, partial [Actinophytocola sp.]|nr:S8 family serine peptidase [Actinophytocola sp.]
SGETDDMLVSAGLGECTSKVVNLSFGGFTPNGGPSASLVSAINKAVQRDQVLVAAAGNDGTAKSAPNRRFWPAAMESVIAVGAYDSAAPNQLWEKTNRADVYAPGVKLLSAHIPKGNNPETGAAYDGWVTWSGTSFAAPLVAAHLVKEIAGMQSGRRQKADAWWRGLPDGGLPGSPGWIGKIRQAPAKGKKFVPTKKHTP